MNTIAVVCMLPFFTVIDADTCPNVTVADIFNQDGDVGKLFMFSAEEFTKMVGYDKWLGQKFSVVQSGSRSWKGTVEVWKEGNTSVGKKSKLPADSDWKVNDTIELSGCRNPDNPCKDVTFGECDPNSGESKVISMNSLQSVQLCNEKCYDTLNCTTYRYNNQTKECTLITGDFRFFCNIKAGPVDKNPVDCLGQIRNPICDPHVEEDCKYNGEPLFSIQTDDLSDCQETCKEMAPLCKYWIHDKRTNSCKFKKDARKTCVIQAGPVAPSYQFCRDQEILN